MVGISEPEYTVHPNDIIMMFKANMIFVAQKDDTVNAILALIVTSSSCDIPYIRPRYTTLFQDCQNKYRKLDSSNQNNHYAQKH